MSMQFNTASLSSTPNRGNRKSKLKQENKQSYQQLIEHEEYKVPSKLLKVNKNRISNTMARETPGGEATEEAKEDIEAFKHEYYELSIKLIDLMLLGKEELMGQYMKEVKLQQVYYEEPLDNDNTLLMSEGLRATGENSETWRK